jgi:hypothetical protein
MSKLVKLAGGAVAALTGLTGVSLGLFVIGVWQASGVIRRALIQAHAEAVRAGALELLLDGKLVVVGTIPAG